MTAFAVLLVLAVVWLAWSNGANDNFKGVATLYGSGVRDYRWALGWSLMATLGGSLLSVLLASALLSHFSGKGLVPPQVAQQPPFALSVALGAAATVWLATCLGMPISTTHALVGALVGAGWVLAPQVQWSALGRVFLLPLLVSPLVAVACSAGAYRVLHWTRVKLGIQVQHCICVGQEVVEVVCACSQTAVAQRMQAWSLRVDDPVVCQRRYQGRVLGMEMGRILDGMHHLSAAAVCFARGVNDTPKIAALLLLAWQWPTADTALVAGAMALGGWLQARPVAETLSHRITTMNPGQGLAANLITAAVVLGASRLGLPVSTTHVSCGSLIGVGASMGQARWGWIAAVLTAWVITLPLAAALAASVAVLMSTLG